MELKELKKELKQAINNGDLHYSKRIEAIKRFKDTGDLEILKTIEKNKDAKARAEKNKDAKARAEKIKETEWQDLTELDALRLLVSQNNTIISDQKSIKGWLTFFGILAIINILVSIIFYLVIILP